jgi:type II secretory ATPase GspE/PulE/Tfp pilus assembly ATPase PilB-like protein
MATPLTHPDAAAPDQSIAARHNGHANGAHTSATGPAAPARGTLQLTEKPALDPAAARLITAEQAARLRVVPYGFAGRRLLAVMADPTDDCAADELSVVARRPVTRAAVPPEMFDDLLRAAFGATATQMAERLGGGGEGEDDLLANLQAVDASDVQRMAEEPSVINLVNLIILEAVKGRASDVHVEPFDRQLTVKYRVDGELRPANSPPKALQAAITSRIKIMSGMDIAERYVPQDGHITLRFEGRKVDIRVSTVPTIYGESVVMRILDKQAVQLDLQALGMGDEHRAAFDKVIALPHGMVLVTGPTGSGKTTSLYAALSKLYDPSLKIITIEDPVEYELAGVNQIPVNPDRGLSFASGLRAILRQDPDVVMVGEIRDGETADIAVRAALTGHLILSTLHTNDAASAIGRLLDMEIEPFLLASVIEAVMAQRLGRRICQHCKRPDPIPEVLQHRLMPVEKAMFPGMTATRGAGCDKCDNSGYRSRIGYYEMMLVASQTRAAITAGRTSSPELLSTLGPNHVTMRRDGLIKASRGLTTVEEVLRATQDAEG